MTQNERPLVLKPDVMTIDSDDDDDFVLLKAKDGSHIDQAFLR